MKKYYIPILIILFIAILIILNPKKINQSLLPVSVPTTESNDKLKQELLISFKNFRESIYKLKQSELIKSLERKSSKEVFMPEICTKMAYDLQAFVMRARLAPRAIEKSDCEKMNRYFASFLKFRFPPKMSKPSYSKRLGKDVSYFAEELNKQAWSNEELKNKKIAFDHEARKNLIKLTNSSKKKKHIKASQPKCIKTILVHEKDFRKVCKIQN